MSADRSLPRRTFLARLSGLGVFGLLGQALAWFRPSAALGAKPKHAAANTAQPPQVSIRDVTAADFAPFVGTRFRVVGGPGKFADVTLLGVTPASAKVLKSAAPTARQAFSLIFQGPAGRAFPQDTYPILHPAIGAFNLFLVPIGRHAAPVYEAVFG